MFAQLDTKTVYSFMDSLVDLGSYIQKAKSLGYQTIGIMDKDSLYAGFHFIKEAQKAGIQPVLGLEAELSVNGESCLFYFIAKNTQGYKNLLKLSTLQMSSQLTYENLAEYLSGVALVLPYFEGIDRLDLAFDYYIGVYQDSPQRNYSQPLLPLQTVRYFDDEEIEIIQMLHAIRDNKPLRETEAGFANQALLSCEVMTQRFEEIFPQALSNLEELVSGISYHFDTDLKLPRFNREREAAEELAELTESGLRAKNLWFPVYQERLQKELTVIHKMGFDDYFLIVWDLLRFGRSRGYYMGMGRGSAAGSLVSFALDITGIDPVENNLLFERFLNEERYSMPDIDIDLPDIYRSDFLHYVRNRYGSLHSAQIVTFSTFGAKQAVRDVFKRFGLTEYELTDITKKIRFRDSLSSVYETNLAFRQMINSRAEYQKAYRIAKRIEGQPRQTSIHAAGIVMSDDDLTEHIPLKAGEDMMITQYDAGAVEANGLLKMDFLGLRNLTFVQKMQEKLAETQGTVIDIKAIDLEDKQTLALFAAGKTKGIFQFEQSGAINLLKRIKPQKFEDIVATTSLNRPGASDYTENYIRRRFGRERVDLFDETLAPILEPTYGIMLYQEQVMQIAQVYAGFTLGKADLLRRAMSKKNHAEMQDMEADFLAGAQRLGHPLETAQNLFARMAKFAGYGFNRSHAFAYSALAFQLAFFKAHYPAIFYDIMLNYSSSDYIVDALESGFEVGKVEINSVPYTDKIVQDRISLGMRHLKGFPQELAYWIIDKRPFQSVEDFLTQLPPNFQKRDYIIPLIRIGAFDAFEPNRKKIEANLDHLFTFVNELGSLFADSAYNWLETDDYSGMEKYQIEQELLGIGLSPHPLFEIAKQSRRTFQTINDLQENTEATILIQIQKIRVIRTKSKGQQMAFLKVTDAKKTLDVTVFPESYQQFKSLLQEGSFYYLLGKVQKREGQLQMILNGAEEAGSERFWILLQDHRYDREISAVLSEFKGEIPVVLHYRDSKETIQSQTYYVQKNQTLAKRLEQYVLKTVFR
ncbi:DNA polymerase III subunit alpha [Streptococcus pantholopis]|uniref:DNA polymerase III subunit alpha n=1 Tax=Streptococcus pantholopis TaxID=1811193 RepID=A0A172Q7G1_9STRE|nr:DNA polymerase III subunit alpha [Streptococcus pantholopis]AND79433.1 DNA polymerase III subunit alpha [Streptococcus pantholopis]